MHTKKRYILVTAAFPYSNGPIHLGHMVGYIQSDIWVRFQRLSGNSCLYICGEDAHGTAVMIAAQKLGISPEVFVTKMHKEHARDFSDFLINFDNFYTTHSSENRILSEFIYQKLKENGDIFTETVLQAYDPMRNIFLPDRFIRGLCPRCRAPNQYGDVCELCGATYNPTELINPISAFSGTKPIQKYSKHCFFALNRYRNFLKHWISEGHLQPQVVNKLNEWFANDLKAWNISRDSPYFGFKIPDLNNKYFYVWMDAPVGYMASLKNLIERRAEIDFDFYWKEESATELYHFIGKDIIYFHTLFWPAILSSANFRLPTKICVHGYLTIKGQKMSKSRETFITARQYLKSLNLEYLRYYFAAKLGSHIEDIDFNPEDFFRRINADLVGKYINLASRCASFFTKNKEIKLSETLPELLLYESFIEVEEKILQYYETLNYRKVVRTIMTLTDRANQYIDKEKPWILAREPGQEKRIQAVCTQGLNLFKILTTYLKPILPNTAQKVEIFLNCGELNFENLKNPLLAHPINPFHPLIQRITLESIVQLLQ
ncbi:methionine--tRNA ligase [Coxiella endosymbiont of Amblyomma sculptum]|uniref:methionine--tRNA ligase n=1 Tax=Coxiella endosymbiont of Amblyomma sculptum TaxID=2487929 RepID=UPI00132EF08F|nr:methionine--tRNA ligase [Coxiella endosymbiont of Amblyomma sculptum]QHG92266.1 methionine--tRNA ligase [Coxiella endosymbiont of Amblyomma sculptum]